MSTASARPRSSVRWSGSRYPLSATAIRPDGTRGRRWRARRRSVCSVSRSRLLIPTIASSSARARSSSAASCTSTRASSPSDRASPWSPRSWASSRQRTISSTADAPAAHPARICTGSTMKSFMRMGRPEAAEAARRSESDPPKASGSVSTETAEAPASLYARARAPGSSSRIDPALGLFLLNSAITDSASRPPIAIRNEGGSRSGGAGSGPAASCAALASAPRTSRSSTRAVTPRSFPSSACWSPRSVPACEAHGRTRGSPGRSSRRPAGPARGRPR